MPSHPSLADPKLLTTFEVHTSAAVAFPCTSISTCSTLSILGMNESTAWKVMPGPGVGFGRTSSR